MELIKILDNDFLQFYKVKNPDELWKKIFGKKYVYVLYDVVKGETCIDLDDTFDLWKILSICHNEENTLFAYGFSVESEKKLKRNFKNIKKSHEKRKINNFSFNKYCGINPGYPELLSKENNVLLSIYSLNKYCYNPTFMEENLYVLTNYNELLKMNKKEFYKGLNKIVAENNNKQIKKNKKSKIRNPFINFVTNLKEHFPINHGGTIRKFKDIIKIKDLTSYSTKENEKIKYYIGYDAREIDAYKENKLVQYMEKITDETTKSEKPEGFTQSGNQDFDRRESQDFDRRESQDYKDRTVNWMVIYETYNNSLNSLIKLCQQAKINYKIPNKHSVLINEKDYDKIAFNICATVPDFL